MPFKGWFIIRLMARNRREVGSEIKREQIEDAACVLFLGDGYESTSMAAIARAAGVAPNTLYWYFTSKDALLVAILDRLVNRAIDQLTAMQEQSFSDQMTWLLLELQRANKLISIVHARLDVSDIIREWHDRFHAMFHEFIVNRIMSKGMPRAKASMMATVGTYVMEGLLSHPHESHEAEQVIGWLTGSYDL
jgi:TetR/AcrR family transcriptional regulator of autoinduction and epiphytic fitness